MILDFHTHCFPPGLAERALAALSRQGGIPFLHQGTPAALDAFERAGGCDGYVVLPVATNPRQTEAVNRFAGGLADEGRHLYAFGSVHPANEDFAEHLRVIKGLGLRGVKLHPEYQAFNVDDPALFPLYEAIFAHGLPLLFHAGADIGFPPPLRAAPEKLAAVARRYPEGTIIAAHLGDYQTPGLAAAHLAPLPNVYADLAFVAGRLPPQDLAAACAPWPPGRLLFGSDSPWADVSAAIAAVQALAYSEAEKAGIFWGNGARLLNMS